MIDRHHGGMTDLRRLLIPGALIAVPVIFAAGSIALAQTPPSPQIPTKPVVVQLAPSAEPSAPAAPQPMTPVVPVPAPAPAPAPVPAPAPAPQVGDDDDDDDDGGDDD